MAPAPSAEDHITHLLSTILFNVASLLDAFHVDSYRSHSSFT
jgi:hypothetical protein